MAVSKAEFQEAVRQMNAHAVSFGMRAIKAAEVRDEYMKMVRLMSECLLEATETGAMSYEEGAKVAHELRNWQMELSRMSDSELGRAYAKSLKTKGLAFDDVMQSAMRKLGYSDREFGSLTRTQQNRVLRNVIESAGRDRVAVSKGIPKLRFAGRAFVAVTVIVAVYNIGTSNNPVWQTGRETAGAAGGIGGGFLGGATAGAIGGAWAGPVGVAVGIIIGGAVGALLADHAYIESVGVSDTTVRAFIARFTGTLTGVDEAGMAKAIANEHGRDPDRIARILTSMDQEYHTDADDVTMELVGLMRTDAALRQTVAGTPTLRDLMVRLLDEGWTTGSELEAITYLRGLGS